VSVRVLLRPAGLLSARARRWRRLPHGAMPAGGVEETERERLVQMLQRRARATGPASSRPGIEDAAWAKGPEVQRVYVRSLADHRRLQKQVGASQQRATLGCCGRERHALGKVSDDRLANAAPSALR
jgi:hypothetical protein